MKKTTMNTENVKNNIVNNEKNKMVNTKQWKN